MKTQLTAVLLAAALALAACGGSDDTPPPTTEVPGSASASPSGFIAYLKALTASTGTEALEPVDVGSVTSPPADDISEPQVID
jgi:ABC-type glycerol-3-phosphate transport system substrate-binding protein